MFSLVGKSAIITGGGRGIGRGISRQMSAAGAGVTICGRTLQPLEDTAAELRAAGGRVNVVVADITRQQDIDGVVASHLAEFGYADCLVNNAGGGDDTHGPLIEITEDQWDKAVGFNLKWQFFCALAVARTMTRGGSIINITSRSGNTPSPAVGLYGASKAGVQNLSATMAAEWGHLNIRVNCVAPGVVPTESSDWISRPTALKRQTESVPLRRLGTVDEFGAICVFFASDEASWVTGQVLQAHGGNPHAASLLRYLHHVNAQAEGREEKRPIF